MIAPALLAMAISLWPSVTFWRCERAGVGADVHVISDVERIQGELSADSVLIERSGLLVLAGSTTLRAAREIVIEGGIDGRSPKAGNPGHDAANLTLVAGERIVVKGAILCGHGSDGDAISVDGGDGGSLLLRAPVIIVRRSDPFVGGNGGGGGPGGRGGRGGDVVLVGRVLADFGSAVQLRGGDAGDGGDAVRSGLPGGDGGRGGNAFIIGWDEEIPHFAAEDMTFGRLAESSWPRSGARDGEDAGPGQPGGAGYPGVCAIGGRGGHAGDGANTVGSGAGGDGGRGGDGGSAWAGDGGRGGAGGAPLQDRALSGGAGGRGGRGGAGGAAVGGVAGSGGDGGKGSGAAGGRGGAGGAGGAVAPGNGGRGGVAQGTPVESDRAGCGGSAGVALTGLGGDPGDGGPGHPGGAGGVGGAGADSIGAMDGEAGKK